MHYPCPLDGGVRLNGLKIANRMVGANAHLPSPV
jgi:hypothetical protein